MLTEQTIEDTDYTDVNVPLGIYTYQVTAVYTKGESAGSNRVTLQRTSGAETAVADGVTVTTGNRNIVITSPQATEVQITAIDGVVIAKTTVNDSATFDVVSGVYIVSTPGATYKVVVK